MESLGGKRDRGDRPQVPHKEDKGPDLAAPLVAVSKEFHHTEGRVEGGGGVGGKRRRDREGTLRVRDKAASVCVPRIRVPRPWNTFTDFTANRHVYTMLIIRRSRWYPFTTPDSLLAYHDPALVGRSTSFRLSCCRELEAGTARSVDELPSNNNRSIFLFADLDLDPIRQDFKDSSLS